MDLNLLVGELQALIAETKRKYPDVKDAAEKSLAILKPASGPPAVDVTKDGVHSDILMSPILLGCKTKVAKVIGISIGALQRLVGLGAVPPRSVPQVLQTLGAVMNQGVDIQLRILQTVLSVLTHCGEIHAEILGDALLLCFKLQDSKTSVVSSTAAASLRQAVMLVFDRVGLEDSLPTSSSSSSSSTPITIPGESESDPPQVISLSPSALDAYNVFSDLCLLTGGAGGTQGGISGFLYGAGGAGGKGKEKARLLKLGSVQGTFGLELIESVLSGFEEGVKKHVELLSLLRHALCPLLLKNLHDKPPFPVALRLTRLIYLLLRSFLEQLIPESEIFLRLLIKLASGDGDPLAMLVEGVGERERGKEGGGVPGWMRILAMEILRGLSNDTKLLETIWMRYDSVPNHANIFTSLISTLNRLATEKPALLGVATQMYGLGVTPEGSHLPLASIGSSPSGIVSGSGGYLDMGLSVVASAASVGVNTVSAMIGSDGPGLSTGSAMKVQCIEQLDKVEAPIMPETYMYLLVLQTLDTIAGGLRPPEDSSVDSATYEAREISAQTRRRMADAAWPALLAAFSYFLGTNLSDDLFLACLQSMQAFIIACGKMELVTPREAFMNTLAKYGMPPQVVSAMQTYSDPPPTPKGVLSADSLGLTALGAAFTPSGPPSLSDRNLACLKALIETAQTIGPIMGDSWHDVFEVLQNANHVIQVKRSASSRKTSNFSSPQINASPRKPSYGSNTTSLDQIQQSVENLFASSRRLEDQPFCVFVEALCRLSGEMIGFSAEGDHLHALLSSGTTTPPRRNSITLSSAGSPSTSTPDLFNNSQIRRPSGLRISQASRNETSFSLDNLHLVAIQNIDRLIQSDRAWEIVTGHLISVCRHVNAPSNLRLRAADALGQILVEVTNIIGDYPDNAKAVQCRVFAILQRQIDLRPISQSPTTDLDVRLRGINTFAMILESSGHAITEGWEVIFGIIDSVCQGTAESTEPEPTASSDSANAAPRTLAMRLHSGPTSKGTSSLVRAAFPTLTLIVSDYLSTLDPALLHLCVSSLGKFGRQGEEVNISLAAIGSLWNLSDAVRSTLPNLPRQGAEELWQEVLAELVNLALDGRQEVRTSALTTLFRCIDQHGSELPPATWKLVIFTVIFPTVEGLASSAAVAPGLEDVGSPKMSGRIVTERSRWNESQTLTWTSVAAMFSKFAASHILQLENASEIVERMLLAMSSAFTGESQSVSTAALHFLLTLVEIGGQSGAPNSAQTTLRGQLWQTYETLSTELTARAHSAADAAVEARYTQDTLLAFIKLSTVMGASTDSTLSSGQIQQLLTAARTASTYDKSPSYASDVDSGTPVQVAQLSFLEAVLKAHPTSRPLILEELVSVLTLPYMAAFDYDDQSMYNTMGRKAVVKSMTYVAMWKQAIRMAEELILQNTDDRTIYEDGMVERLLGAVSIPIKLRYDCPAANKYGEDLPLWKSATSSFIATLPHVLKSITASTLGEESLWHQIVDVIRCSLLADCSCIQDMTSEQQRSDETFDLKIITLIRSSVLPRIGHSDAPTSAINLLADALVTISEIWVYEDGKHVAGGEKRDGWPTRGSIESAVELDRERFRFASLGLLFDACESGAASDSEAQIRCSRIFVPRLVSRCEGSIRAFLLDLPLKGMKPFERIREEEIAVIYWSLGRLRLSEGVWPVETPQGAEITALSPVQTAISTSPVAHLFYFYSRFLRTLTLPGSLPVVPVSMELISPDAASQRDGEGEAEPLVVDIRVVAGECLELLGKEMHVGVGL